MGDSGVGERADLPLRAGRPVFDLFASKLRRSRMRPGTVPRSPLIERPAGVIPVRSSRW
jgi:hypothetical protein